MVAQTNGKIYKVQNIAGDKIYIGSTNKKYLSQRMDTHRGNYKQWKKENHGHIRAFDIFEEFGIENCVILLIENFPCGSKEELRAREATFIQTMECVNKNIPGRTVKQYYIDNKEHLIKKQKQYNNVNKNQIKQYYEDNKETIVEQKKQYFVDNKEHLIEKHKQYYVDNKDQINEKQKQYDMTHKDQIIEKKKQYRVDNKESISIKAKARYQAKKQAKLDEQIEYEEVAVIDDQNNIIAVLDV